MEKGPINRFSAEFYIDEEASFIIVKEKDLKALEARVEDLQQQVISLQAAQAPQPSEDKAGSILFEECLAEMEEIRLKLPYLGCSTSAFKMKSIMTNMRFAFAQAAVAEDGFALTAMVHEKRKSVYILEEYACLQCDGWFKRTEVDGQITFTPVDMDVVGIYRAVTDGNTWVRPLDELTDGRFTFAKTTSQTEIFSNGMKYKTSITEKD